MRDRLPPCEGYSGVIGAFKIAITNGYPVEIVAILRGNAKEDITIDKQ